MSDFCVSKWLILNDAGFEKIVFCPKMFLAGGKVRRQAGGRLMNEISLGRRPWASDGGGGEMTTRLVGGEPGFGWQDRVANFSNEQKRSVLFRVHDFRDGNAFDEDSASNY